MQVPIYQNIRSIYLRIIHISEKNNIDIGMDIANDLERLKDDLNQFKKSNPGADLGDIDIQQLDWVEDNKRVKAFFIYESSVWLQFVRRDKFEIKNFDLVVAFNS